MLIRASTEPRDPVTPGAMIVIDLDQRAGIFISAMAAPLGFGIGR